MGAAYHRFKGPFIRQSGIPVDPSLFHHARSIYSSITPGPYLVPLFGVLRHSLCLLLRGGKFRVMLPQDGLEFRETLLLLFAIRIAGVLKKYMYTAGRMIFVSVN